MKLNGSSLSLGVITVGLVMILAGWATSADQLLSKSFTSCGLTLYSLYFLMVVFDEKLVDTGKLLAGILCIIMSVVTIITYIDLLSIIEFGKIIKAQPKQPPLVQTILVIFYSGLLVFLNVWSMRRQKSFESIKWPGGGTR